MRRTRSQFSRTRPISAKTVRTPAHAARGAAGAGEVISTPLIEPVAC